MVVGLVVVLHCAESIMYNQSTTLTLSMLILLP